jgi:hypothetical protein
MPVSRPTADGLTDELGGLYRALERELAAGIAERLASGLEAEDWQTRKLAATGEVRRWITNTVRRMATGRAARRAVLDAFERGAGEAQRELAGSRSANIPGVQRDLPGAHAIDRLGSALAGRLDGTHLQIVRSAEDAYRRVVAAPSALVLGGALTRRQAAERVWNGLLDQGFTGFVDKAGRKWTAAGYAEMATRTATAQAAVQGHLDRMAELGIDLVIVSNAAQECRLCRPWEGKVLTRSGPNGARTVQAESELTGEPVKVHVAGSLAEAIQAGLLHPNCRHSVSAYLPGVTKPITDTADPEGDAARQKLRYLEREQRRWRLREAGALSPEDRAAAAAKVRERQAQIKAHVKAHDLTRRRDRERLDLGNKRVKGEPTPAPAPAPKPEPAPPKPPAPAPKPAAPPAPPAPVVRKVNIAMGTPEEARIAGEEFDRHARLVPRAMGNLQAIRVGTEAELNAVSPNAVAFYRESARELVMRGDPFAEEHARTGRRCSNIGWWTKCPHDLAGGRQTLAHELGHHIDMSNMRHWSQSEEYMKIWHALADELGVPRLVVQVSGKIHFVDGLTAWIQSNKAGITRLVSEYGAASRLEFLAEIWGEYSLDPAGSRPFVRKIGEMMRRIAEMPEPTT